jgi:hypothetical protein
MKSASPRTPAHPATPHYLFACPISLHALDYALYHGPQSRIDAYDVDRAWFIPVVQPFAPNYAAVEPTPNTLLAAGQGIVAIWNVFPAENAGHAGVNGQTQPLAGLVCRTLHRDARQVRHGPGFVN